MKHKAKCLNKDEVEDDDSVVDDDPHGQVADPGNFSNIILLFLNLCYFEHLWEFVGSKSVKVYFI